MRNRKFLALLFWAAAALSGIAFSSPVLAVEPDEVLDNPVLEERAREISEHLRCVVCQSQNIDNSNAPLAKDMRVLLRERLEAGDTDDQVYDYFVARYGDYVLLKPPVQENTLFLWAAPMLVFAAAGFAAWTYLSGMRRKAAAGSGATTTMKAGEKPAPPADRPALPADRKA